MDVWRGLADVAPLLVTAIPLGIYNFTEAMNNVESASAAGDNYNLRKVLLADGVGAIVGSMLGSPFPPAVYIGHPGWKAVGGRIGYSLATGVAIALVCFLGLTALLLAVIPLVAILPILLYIGLVIGAQAFQASPAKHAPAVVLAIIPNIAEWAKTQIDGALAAAGTSAAQVGLAKLAGTGVLYAGSSRWAAAPCSPGMVLGAMAVFIIDSQIATRGGMGLRRRDPRVRRADPRLAARLGGLAAGRARLRAVRRDVPRVQRSGRGDTLTPTRSRLTRALPRSRESERSAASAASARSESDTQPKMPPCALIISSADALELGEVRADAIGQHDAFVAAVVRLAHRGVDAHLGGHAADDERLDAAVVQDEVEVGRAERALAGLVDHDLAGDG